MLHRAWGIAGVEPVHLASACRQAKCNGARRCLHHVSALPDQKALALHVQVHTWTHRVLALVAAG